MKNFILSIFIAVILVLTVGCGNNKSTGRNNSSTQQEVQKKKTAENPSETWREKEKRIFEQRKAELFANPFQEQPLSARKLKSDFLSYEGRNILLGPLRISQNRLERKIVVVYSLITKENSNLFASDLDSMIDIKYDRLGYSNKDPIDLEEDDVIFVKGFVEVERNSLWADAYVVADEIICNGTSKSNWNF